MVKGNRLHVQNSVRGHSIFIFYNDFQAFNSGVHYWELTADDRTENELKIGIFIIIYSLGVSTKLDFNYNSAFCDFEFGFAYYGLGQLRYNSNASGG